MPTQLFNASLNGVRGIMDTSRATNVGRAEEVITSIECIADVKRTCGVEASDKP